MIDAEGQANVVGLLKRKITFLSPGDLKFFEKYLHKKMADDAGDMTEYHIGADILGRLDEIAKLQAELGIKERTSWSERG